MAPEPKQQDKPEAKTAPPQAAPAPHWKRVLAGYAVPAALAVSILANLAGVFYFRALAQGASKVEMHEIPLGEYRFVAEEHEPGQVTDAQFALHIELVRQAEKPARQILQKRRQKVRQNVEELLRTAHGGDFNDPALTELKSQLQKRINETLGIRAVADVIVTDLQMERSQLPNVTVGKSEQGIPWVEPTTS